MNDPGSTLTSVVNGLNADDSKEGYPDESLESSGIISDETSILVVVMLATGILIAAGSYFVR